MLENAAHLGLPIPEKLKSVLAQLHNKSDKDNTGGEDDGKSETPPPTTPDAQ